LKTENIAQLKRYIKLFRSTPIEFICEKVKKVKEKEKDN
jgi:hypothetical protein